MILVESVVMKFGVCNNDDDLLEGNFLKNLWPFGNKEKKNLKKI